MQDNRVARRYARALFATALKYDIVNSVEDDLANIDAVLFNDPEFRYFLSVPNTSRDEKMRILERVFSDRVTALTLQVLRVMLEKRREREIPQVRREFVALRREYQGIVHVTVTSAEVMAEDQRQSLIARLGELLGKKIESDFQIEPSLIGGVRVSYQNYVLDGSARGALSKLRERLKYDLLKRLG